MGFDIKRFLESDIKEEFICPICCDILEDPVLLESCEHVFCKLCIDEWLQKCERKLCPIDRQEINDKSLRPPQRSFRNLITSLLICCDFNSNGCQKYVRIEELSLHSSKCMFNPVIMNEDIECPSDCGAIVKRCGSIDEHNCVSFLKRIILSNNQMIQKLNSETQELQTENTRLKTESIELKGKYDDAIQQLRDLSKDKEDLSVEIIRTKNQLLSTDEEMERLNEEINSLNEINSTKDQTLEEMGENIKSLKKENQKLIEMTKLRTSDRNGSISSDSQIQTLDLLTFDTLDNDSNTGTTQSIDILSIETSLENRRLVETLCRKGFLKNDGVIQTMLSIDRGLFAPSAASYALHHIRQIGHGAHTGPATYEATLLQFLEHHLTKNCKILDIGSGSGYLTSCIAKMIEPNGKVIGIEHIPQIFQQSIQTIDKYYPSLKESGVLKMYLSDGRFGCASEAPFDIIFVEPLTRRVPQKLIDQVKLGGCIIVPIGARDKDINLELFTKQRTGEVFRQVLCDDWKLMQENTLDLFEDKKMQLRSGWKVKLGF